MSATFSTRSLSTKILICRGVHSRMYLTAAGVRARLKRGRLVPSSRFRRRALRVERSVRGRNRQFLRPLAADARVVPRRVARRVYQAVGLPADVLHHVDFPGMRPAPVVVVRREEPDGGPEAPPRRRESRSNFHASVQPVASVLGPQSPARVAAAALSFSPRHDPQHATSHVRVREAVRVPAERERAVAWIVRDDGSRRRSDADTSARREFAARPRGPLRLAVPVVVDPRVGLRVVTRRRGAVADEARGPDRAVETSAKFPRGRARPSGAPSARGAAGPRSRRRPARPAGSRRRAT